MFRLQHRELEGAYADATSTGGAVEKVGVAATIAKWYVVIFFRRKKKLRP